MHIVFSLIEEFLNSYSENRSGVVAGTKFIDYLLDQVLTQKERIMCYRYFNLENRNSFQIYHFKEEQEFYFGYQKREDSTYSFSEIAKEEAFPEESHILTLKFMYKDKNNALSNKHPVF